MKKKDLGADEQLTKTSSSGEGEGDCKEKYRVGVRKQKYTMQRNTLFDGQGQ